MLLAFYLLYIVGVLIFAVAPAIRQASVLKAMLYGALFGAEKGSGTGGKLNFCWTCSMPRRPRIHIDGLPLHIVQRGTLAPFGTVATNPRWCRPRTICCSASAASS
jgi:hypothetical protein